MPRLDLYRLVERFAHLEIFFLTLPISRILLEAVQRSFSILIFPSCR